MLTSATQRRVSAVVGSVCGMLPAVLAHLPGLLGGRVRGRHLRTALVRGLGGSLRHSVESGLVNANDLAGVLLPCGRESTRVPPEPSIEEQGHDGETSNALLLQGKLGKLSQQSAHAGFYGFIVRLARGREEHLRWMIPCLEWKTSYNVYPPGQGAQAWP